MGSQKDLLCFALLAIAHTLCTILVSNTVEVTLFDIYNMGQWSCHSIAVCVCLCVRIQVPRPFSCMWWMFLIERQRSSVPHATFTHTHTPTLTQLQLAAFLRYQTHVVLAPGLSTALFSVPRLVCTLSPPSFFNRKLLRRVPDWSGVLESARELRGEEMIY